MLPVDDGHVEVDPEEHPPAGRIGQILQLRELHWLAEPTITEMSSRRLE